MWNGINLTLNYFNSPPLPPHTLPSPLVLYKTEKKQIKVKVQNDFYGDLWPFNAKCPKIVRHRPATYLKRSSGAARLSKCVWSFWNFMHSRAKSLWHHCLGTVNCKPAFMKFFKKALVSQTEIHKMGYYCSHLSSKSLHEMLSLSSLDHSKPKWIIYQRRQ